MTRRRARSSTLRLRDRPTPDLIVMWLAFVVGVIIIGSLVAGVVLRITNPDVNLSTLGIRIAGFVNTIIGAIVGYLAGRGVPTASAEGEQPPTRGRTRRGTSDESSNDTS